MAKELTEQSRESVIIRTSIIGILANVVLAAFKAFVGLTANSIAVVLDAVNNLSDALSSVITIIGTKLAGKQPDKKHPMGYGRIEYMSQLIVAAIVLYAGVTSLTESIKKIIHPETADYSMVSLIIIIAAIAVKLILGTYVKKKGNEVNSGSLVASGSDALFDAILSVSVLASAIIFLTTGIALEAFVGVIIAVIIIKSGIEMVMEAVDEMLGMRISGDLSKQIKALVKEDEKVYGAYDLLLNNYGPDRYVGSVHVEVDDTMTAQEIDDMTRRIQDHVFQESGIFIGTVGIYSRNMDEEAANVRTKVTEFLTEHEGVLQVHGFYYNKERQSMSFDVVLDFAVEDRKALREQLKKEVEELYPGFNVRIALDIDISD